MNAGIETNALIDKVGGLLRDLEARGVVYLYAFAERDDLDRWDIVLSSDWSDKDPEEAVSFVYNKLRPHIAPREMVLISRISIIPTNDPRISELTKRLMHISPEDHLVVPSRMIYNELLGSGVRLAFIFKAERLPENADDAQLDRVVTHS